MGTGSAGIVPISSPVAIAVLVGWAALTFTASWLWARSGRRSADHFMVAGRQAPHGVATATVLAGWIWAASITAPAQAGFKYGLAGPLYYALGGGLMLAVFAPFASRIRALAPAGHTLPEFIALRHGQAGRNTVLVINLLSVGVLLFFNLSVVGLLFETFTPLGYAVGVVAVAATAAAYTLLSGMAASIVTNCLQFLVITVAALVLVPAITHAAGGPAALVAALPALGEKGLLLSTAAFLKMGLPFFVMSCVSAFAYPDLWQLAWTIRAKDVARTYIAAGLGWIPYAFAFGTLGVLGLVNHVAPGAPSASDIAFTTARAYLSPGLSIVFLILILAAACSTCDTGMSAFAALFMTDIYRAHVNPDASDRQVLTAGRLAMLLFTAVICAVTMRKVSLLDMVFFLGAAKGATLFPLLASLYWKRLTGSGFVAGILTGMTIGAGLFIGLKPLTEYHNLISILASVIVGAVTSIAVSLLSHPPAQADERAPSEGGG